MQKRGLLLTALLLILFVFLTSCQGRVPAGDTPLETEVALQQVQTGTQGVEIELLQNFPPTTIYDESELIALVEVKNKGNFDLLPQDCLIQITGFDPNIITGGFGVPRTCSQGDILEGKNLYNIEGGTEQIEFKSPSIRLPAGVFEYNPKLNFLTCYNYHTVANPEVCVDPLFYQVTDEQKTCIPTNVGMGSGQGAPVGISYVGVNMIGGKALFEINVRNFGSGRVLSSYSNLNNCGQASLSYTDLDRVEYNVQLLGGSLIDCKPRDGVVRLINGQGKIICNFHIPGASAFTTPLLVDLDYNYIKDFHKEIKIIQTPQ